MSGAVNISVTVTDADGASASATTTATQQILVNLGQTTVLPTADSGNANLLAAQPIILSQAATLQSLSFYVTTAGGELILGLYADASGKPGALLAQTAAFTPVVGWNTQTPTSQPSLQPGQYWLAYLPQSNVLAFVKTSAGSGNYHASFTFGPMPSTFPGAITSASQWSFYGTFLEAPPPPGPFPSMPNVTLQAIDGETMTSPTTMSNNYYTRNGFTYAANAGWDSPNFFPIGPYLTAIATQSDANRWLDLGFNTAWVTQGTTGTNLPLLLSNGIWAVQGFGQNGFNANTSTETVGLQSWDEPSTYSQGVSGPIGSCANANPGQDGRFWWINNTWNWLANPGLSLNGAPGSGNKTACLTTSVTTPNTTTRHLDASSIDFYFFSNANNSTILQQAGNIVAQSNSGTALTRDQCSRAFLYGLAISLERSQTTTNQPLFSLVENGGPYTVQTTGASYITPPQLNAAVWSSIMQGARGIVYFNASAAGPSDVPQDNFNSTFCKTVQSGLTNWGQLGGPVETISMYNQAKATNALVRSLASVINSPLAIGYVTVNPVAGSFSGFDVTVKWDGTSFYIFAMPRYSQTLTNQTATFTIADLSATSVSVVGENRSITITNGVFSDTFADGNVVRIYQVVG